ncbi:hypothetical protein RND81_01G169500 [Saponaria officinalis]|uniref:Uncharacterized protein n=1 Tax=Saponaria officinalis TaxID=3572 RepID=A0AAW1N8A7_SAPOF
MWHDGTFSSHRLGLLYTSKCVRTSEVDADELYWFTIVKEAEQCTTFRKNVDIIFYIDPDACLKRVIDDTEGNVIRKQAVLNRVVDCYIVVEKDVGEVMRLIELSKEGSKCTQPKKLTPRRRTGPPHTSPLFEKESVDHNTPNVPCPSLDKTITENSLKTHLKSPQKTPKKPKKHPKSVKNQLDVHLDFLPKTSLLTHLPLPLISMT